MSKNPEEYNPDLLDAIKARLLELNPEHPLFTSFDRQKVVREHIERRTNVGTALVRPGTSRQSIRAT
jgi:hypothetical protein